MSLERCWVNSVWLASAAAFVAFVCPAELAAQAAPCPHTNVATTTAAGDWTQIVWRDPQSNVISDYPDNDGSAGGVAGFCAKIDGVEVTVDDPVSIDGLELVNGGRLLVTKETQGNLTIQNGGGVHIENPGDGSPVTQMQIARDRVITVELGGADVTIGENGRYNAHPVGPQNDQSSLVARNVTLKSTWEVNGEREQMRLSKLMQTEVHGDFVMDARDNQGQCPGYVCPDPARSGDAGGGRGGKTPPILRGASTNRSRTVPPDVGPSPKLIIHGDFDLLCAAELYLSCRNLAVSLFGNFDNQSIYPSCFHWSEGRLYLDNDSEKTFEVGGVDLITLAGLPPDPPPVTGDGFVVQGLPPNDPGPHSNFSMGRITVAPNSTVTFQNEHTNTVGTGPCQEALYVDQLFLGNNSTITLNDVRIYSPLVVGEKKATVILAGTSGCAGIVPVPVHNLPGRCPMIPTVSQWGLIVMALLVMTAGSVVVARRRTALV